MDKVITFSLRRESIDMIVRLMDDALCVETYSENYEEAAYSLIQKLRELSAPITK